MTFGKRSHTRDIEDTAPSGVTKPISEMTVKEYVIGRLAEIVTEIGAELGQQRSDLARLNQLTANYNRLLNPGTAGFRREIARSQTGHLFNTYLARF